MNNELKTVQSILNLIDTTMDSIHLVVGDRQVIPRRDRAHYQGQVARLERLVGRLDDIVLNNPDYNILEGQVVDIRVKYNRVKLLVA